MISDFKNKTAVLTGAGSGFGLEGARIGATAGAAVAAASGNIIAGAIVAVHASVTGTARPYVYVMLGRPTGPSDLS